MNIGVNFIKIFEEVLSKYYDDNYRSRKTNEIEYLKGILNCIYSTPYWSRMKYITENKKEINGNILNKKHLEYLRKDIYGKVFNKIINEYIKLTNYNSLMFISSDTSYIYNKCGKRLPRNKF